LPQSAAVAFVLVKVAVNGAMVERDLVVFVQVGAYLFGTKFAADKGVYVLNQLRIELIGLSLTLLDSLALPLGLAVALGVLARAPAVTAALLLPAFVAPCSWPSLHPLNPEQASRVKASAACRYRLFVEAPIVFPPWFIYTDEALRECWGSITKHGT